MLGHPTNQQIEAIKFDVGKLSEFCDKNKVNQILTILTELQSEVLGATPQLPPPHIQSFIEQMMELSKIENDVS